MNVDANSPPEYRDDDALAAEYVLGVLDSTERDAVKARLDREPAFARVVADWEIRLSGLNREYAPIKPPASVKLQLDRRLFDEPAAPEYVPSPGFWNSLAFWRAFSGVALAALAFLAFGLLRPPEDAPQQEKLVAVLSDRQTSQQFVALYDPNDSRLLITRVAGEKAEGRDFEIWLIEEGNPPVSLGLVGVSGPKGPAVPARLAAQIGAGVKLAITDEPLGGSPGGVATGPVVASGEMKKF